MDRAVGVMTQAAVLRDRRMLPQQRPAFLGVAGIAHLVEGRFFQQTFGNRLMNRLVDRMTVTAGHLPEAHGMIGWLVKFRTLFQVAVETHLLLGPGFQYRIVLDVDPVAVGTGQVIHLVDAAFPTDVLGILVAVETHLVLQLHGFIRLDTEIQNGRTLLSAPDLADVSTPFQCFLHGSHTGDTWAVTGLALQSTKGRALVSRLSVLGLEDIEDGVFPGLVMALETGISPFPGVFGKHHGFAVVRLWCSGSRRLFFPGGRIDHENRSKQQRVYKRVFYIHIPANGM